MHQTNVLLDCQTIALTVSVRVGVSSPLVWTSNALWVM